MARLTRVTVLLSIVLAVSSCGNFEAQKQRVVRAASAALFQRVISIQRCVALTPPGLHQIAKPAPLTAPAKTATRPVRACQLRTAEHCSVRRS